MPNSRGPPVTLGHGDDSTADPQDYTLDTQEDNPREVDVHRDRDVGVVQRSMWTTDEDIGMEALVLMADAGGQRRQWAESGWPHCAGCD